MTPPHATVLAAIDKARPLRDGSSFIPDRDAHCDDLRATAERHEGATPPGLTGRWCRVCTAPTWPCPDYRQVIDRLTGWGVLNG